MFEMAMDTWEKFWGEGYYWMLLAIGLAGLFLFSRREKNRRVLALYSLLIGGLFFCPLSGRLISWCIGSEVYWRVLWVLPYSIVIALAGTELWRLWKKPYYQIPLAALLVVLLLISGKNLYLGGAYEVTANSRKVPRATEEICDIINAQKEEGEVIRLAATNAVATYVRVYDASIEMPYSRDGRGCQNRFSKRLYEQMMSNSPDLETEVALARQGQWKYLIHWSLDASVVEWFEAAGYTCLGQVEDYFILKDVS